MPFRFDTHTLLFSKNAVGIEANPPPPADRSGVNRIRSRHEFFYATPQEVKALLIDAAGDLLSFDENLWEALEFCPSQNMTKEEVELGEGAADAEAPSLKRRRATFWSFPLSSLDSPRCNKCPCGRCDLNLSLKQRALVGDLVRASVAVAIDRPHTVPWGKIWGKVTLRSGRIPGQPDPADSA